MKRQFQNTLSILLVFVLVFIMPTNAYASSFTTDEQYAVVEKDGVRIVTDKATGAIASYDMNNLILTIRENPAAEEVVIKVTDYINIYSVRAASGSAASNNNAYAYSSTGNPALWTLQIPNQIKFTYERTQGALISSFVSNVDNLIEAEDNMILLYGAGVVALFGLAVSGAIGAAIVALLGFGVDVAAITKGLNSISTYKEQAEYYFGRIVTYSTP